MTNDTLPPRLPQDTACALQTIAETRTMLTDQERGHIMDAVGAIDAAFRAGMAVTRGDIAQMRAEQEASEFPKIVGFLADGTSAWIEFGKGADAKEYEPSEFARLLRELVRLKRLKESGLGADSAHEAALAIARHNDEAKGVWHKAFALVDAKSIPTEGSEAGLPWPKVTSYAGGASLDGAYAWVDVQLTDEPESTRFLKAPTPREIEGEQLYKMYERAMLATSIQVDTWSELDDTERGAFMSVAIDLAQGKTS